MLSEVKRFNVGACGRRFGKSTVGEQLLMEPAIDGYPVHWFAPTYKIMGDAWREVRAYMAPITSGISEQNKRIELVTGGSIEFWTLDGPDPARSRKAKRVIIDEAGLVPNLKDVWFEAIRPILADLQGDAFLFGTPKGRNFFWEAYTYGQDRENKDWASWQLPTSMNPYINEAEIESARLSMPDRAFRQEFLAEFIEDAGGVFLKVTDAVAEGVIACQPAGKVFLGIDLARVEDFTVITAVDERGKQVYFERFNQISWERQFDRIRVAIDKFPGCLVTMDVTGLGDPIYERVRKMGARVLPYMFSNSSKEALIDSLAMLIERGDLRLFDIREQTNELLAYQYELTDSRNVKMGAPHGMHDDCVIALALAAWGLREKPAEKIRKKILWGNRGLV